ncbi:uncharacterized protein LOC143067004 [Mytilus galloprovincialis]|uniref:uncharacterized protein LOC143067004 n=1 Tax=Mytilus galloprovincialis TaxID=29158 RepID=UPI003F7C7C53
MTCADSGCAWGDRCDGETNCRDDSDEENCNECKSGSFLCIKDERCIPDSYKCDSWPDCSDASDDVGCGDCDDDQFRCGNSHCVNVDKLCDGENDCGDFSDERCNTSAGIPMPVDQPILMWQDPDQYVGHPDILPIAPSVDHMQLPSMPWEDDSGSPSPLAISSKRVSNTEYNKQLMRQRLYSISTRRHDNKQFVRKYVHSRTGHDYRQHVGEPVHSQTGHDYRQHVGETLHSRSGHEHRERVEEPVHSRTGHVYREREGEPVHSLTGHDYRQRVGEQVHSRTGHDYRQRVGEPVHSLTGHDHRERVGEHGHSLTGHDYRRLVGEPVHSRTEFNNRQKSSSLHEDRRQTKVQDNTLSKRMSRLNAYRRLQMAKSIARSLVEKRNRFAAQMQRQESIRHVLAGQKIKHTLAGQKIKHTLAEQKIKHTSQVEEVVRQLKELTASRNSNEHEKVHSRGEKVINDIRRHMSTNGQINEHFTTRQLYDAMQYLRQN